MGFYLASFPTSFFLCFYVFHFDPSSFTKCSLFQNETYIFLSFSPVIFQKKKWEREGNSIEGEGGEGEEQSPVASIMLLARLVLPAPHPSSHHLILVPLINENCLSESFQYPQTVRSYRTEWQKNQKQKKNKKKKSRRVPQEFRMEAFRMADN